MGDGVQSISPATGDVNWTAELGSGPCLAILDDHLVVQCSGEIAMLDPETGAVRDRVAFGADDPTPDELVTQRPRGTEHVATAGDRVLCLDHDGGLHVVDPDAATVMATYDLTVACGRLTGLGDDAVCVVGEDIVRLNVD